MKNSPSLGLGAVKNTHRIKSLKEKLFGIELHTKKSASSAYVYLRTGVELGASKDSHLSKIIMYNNGKADLLRGWTLSKIRIV